MCQVQGPQQSPEQESKRFSLRLGGLPAGGCKLLLGEAKGTGRPQPYQATYRTVPADHCTPRTESDITSHPTRAPPPLPVTSRGGDSCPKIRKKEQVTSRRPHTKNLGFKIVNTVWSFPATWKVLQAPAGNDILKAGAEDQGCSFQASPRRQGQHCSTG